MSKYFWYACFLLFVVGCRKSPSEKIVVGGKVLSINPEVTDADEKMLRTFIDTVEYIPLETNDSILVGKIGQLYQWKDKFYIHDKTSDVVFIFDRRGRFCRKISAVGRGPQEYVRIDAFHFSPYTEKIYIYCAYSQKFLQYDSEGNYETTFPCRYRLYDVVVFSPDTLLMYGGRGYNERFYKDIFPEQYRLVLATKNSAVVNQHLKGRYEKIFNRFAGSSTGFFNLGETVSLLETFGNTIYEIDRGGNMVPRYYIDFGNFQLPVDLNTPAEEATEILPLLRKNSYALIRDLIEVKDILYIKYAYEGYINKALYYKNSGNLINFGMVWGNPGDCLPLPDFFSAYGDFFVGALESHFIKRYADNIAEMPEKIRELAASLTEMDNPCIVKIRFKEM